MYFPIISITEHILLQNLIVVYSNDLEKLTIFLSVSEDITSL